MNNSYVELTEEELLLAQGGSGAGNLGLQGNFVDASNVNLAAGAHGVSQSGSHVLTLNNLSQNAQDNSTRTNLNQQLINLGSFNF
jgi:hypothetical protein